MSRTFMVITAVSSMRAEPGHKGEMVNQLLFGELVEAITFQGEFCKVKAKLDGYEGWCQTRQLVEIEGNGYPMFVRLTTHIDDYVETNGIRVMLSPGSTCFVADSNEPIKLGGYALKFYISPESDNSGHSIADKIEAYAGLFLGTPYLWGGRSRYGIDCSGLTQVVFRLSGIQLPRDSGPQSKGGQVVNLLQEAKTGDLAFFDNEDGRIIHVGIMLGNNKILHASASVRIDAIDNYGIIHKETGERTHKLRVIKRFF